MKKENTHKNTRDRGASTRKTTMRSKACIRKSLWISKVLNRDVWLDKGRNAEYLHPPRRRDPLCPIVPTHINYIEINPKNMLKVEINFADNDVITFTFKNDSKTWNEVDNLVIFKHEVDSATGRISMINVLDAEHENRVQHVINNSTYYINAEAIVKSIFSNVGEHNIRTAMDLEPDIRNNIPRTPDAALAEIKPFIEILENLETYIYSFDMYIHEFIEYINDNDDE